MGPISEVETRLLIHGNFVPAIKGKRFQVISPTTNSVVADVCEADEEDVDIAVRSAQEALPAWSDVDGKVTRLPSTAMASKLTMSQHRNDDDVSTNSPI